RSQPVQASRKIRRVVVDEFRFERRRRRFGSFPDGCGYTGLARSTPAESRAAWRFASLASRRTPKRWRAPPTALLQTWPLQHVRRLGLRPCSVAGLADPTPLAVLLRRVDRQSAATS